MGEDRGGGSRLRLKDLAGRNERTSSYTRVWYIYQPDVSIMTITGDGQLNEHGGGLMMWWRRGEEKID